MLDAVLCAKARHTRGYVIVEEVVSYPHADLDEDDNKITTRALFVFRDDAAA